MDNLTKTVNEAKSHDGETKRDEEIERMDIYRGPVFWTAKISWPAIFSGALVTVVAQMLFTLLGMGIGLAAVSPLNMNSGSPVGAGATIWWSVTMLISLFLGGWTTGRMYLPRYRRELAMHGLLTWCTFTVFSFFMLSSSIGFMVAGAGNVIGFALSGRNSETMTNRAMDRSQGVQSMNTSLSPDLYLLINDARNLLLQPINRMAEDIERSGDQDNNDQDNKSSVSAKYVNSGSSDRGTSGSSSDNGNSGSSGTSRNADQTGNDGSGYYSGNNANKNWRTSRYESVYGDPNAKGQLFISSVQGFFQTGDIRNPETRESLVKSVMHETGMTRTQANAKVDNWINTYEQQRNVLQAKADEASKTFATASITAFIALILGALVTMWGSWVAQRNHPSSVKPA